MSYNLKRRQYFIIPFCPFLLSLIIVTGVMSTRKKLRTSTRPFNYIYTCCRVEQDGGEGTHGDGVCRKNTEANKPSQVRAVIRQEAGYTTNSAWKKLDHPNTLFLTDVAVSEFPSVFLFYFMNCLFNRFFKIFFFHFRLPHIARKHPDTSAYVAKQHGICTKRTHRQISE